MIILALRVDLEPPCWLRWINCSVSLSVCRSVCLPVFLSVYIIRCSAHFTTKYVENDIIMAHIA